MPNRDRASAPFDLLFSLRKPEQVPWEQDADANDSVTVQLFETHRRLQSADPGATDDDLRRLIERELLDLGRRETMSERQKMWLKYQLALSADRYDLMVKANFHRALQWLTDAEDIALNIRNFGALIDALDLNGSYLRRMSEYAEAVNHYKQALRYLRERTADFTSYDPVFEVVLVSKTAQLQFAVGDYHEAFQHVYSAIHLLDLVEHDPHAAGIIKWTLALLMRQREEFPKAYQHVMEAVHYFDQLPASNSKSRLLTFASDNAMDVGELAVAAELLTTAQQVCEQVDDQSGFRLVMLGHSRLERIQNPKGATGAEERIRAVMAWAKAWPDRPLYGIAQAALGVEMLMTGKRALARRWLNAAVVSNNRLRTPGFAYYAERYLRDL